MKQKLHFGLFPLMVAVTILLIVPTKVFAQVIFTDIFNEVSPTLWGASSNNLPTAGWVIKNGMYGYPLPSVITTNSYPLIWDNTKKNISYEVDLIEVGGGVNKNILIKYVDDNNFVNVHSNGDGTYLAGYVNTDQKTYFIYFNPKILSNGDLHHYKIDIFDNKITVYIDNELVFDHLEDTIMFPDWRIGLRTSTGSEAWFDNVMITNLNTPSVTKTVFAPGLMGSWNADAILNCKPETDTEWILAPYAEEVYNPVLTAIRESGWDTLPYYYDWRKPVAENSNKLASFLNSKNIAPNEKVNFVGHSMGGLVGRGYLQTSDGSKLSSLLAVGTPNKGSAYAYPPWEGGEIWSNNLIEKIALTIYLKRCGQLNQNDMEIIREQIPSVRDLLPTDPYLLRKKTPTTYLPGNTENQNTWLNDLSQDSKGVRIGYIAGTGIDTVKTIQTKDPHKKDVMENLWIDGRPSGKIISTEGDGTVLVSSATLSQADWGATINQTHRGLVNSIEGMSKILEFLNLSKPSDILSINENSIEPDSALVVISYPANFVITDGSGKSKNSKDGMVAFMNPKSGNYKLNLISKSGNTTLIVAQFLPNGDVKYKEYNLKGIGPKFKTLKFDSQNPQEDILKP